MSLSDPRMGLAIWQKGCGLLETNRCMSRVTLTGVLGCQGLKGDKNMCVAMSFKLLILVFLLDNLSECHMCWVVRVLVFKFLRARVALKDAVRVPCPIAIGKLFTRSSDYTYRLT